jgi:hypothetical protein
MKTEDNQVSIPLRKDRWLRFLVVSLLLNFGSAILFPWFLTDGLTLKLALICGLPTMWGFFIFLSFHTRRERFVGYAAILPAIIWLAAIADLLTTYGWAGL